MSTPHAVYTIAHDEGMDISKYLSAEETAEVRGLKTPPPPPPPPPPARVAAPPRSKSPSPV